MISGGRRLLRGVPATPVDSPSINGLSALFPLWVILPVCWGIAVCCSTIRDHHHTCTDFQSWKENNLQMLINFNRLTPRSLMTRGRYVCLSMNSCGGEFRRLYYGINLYSKCFSKASTTRSAPLIGSTLTHWTVLRPPLVSSLSSQAARDSAWRKGNRATLTYVVALAVAVVGMSYAAVPLYRLFCQASGYGGTVKKGHGGKVEHMKPVTERLLTLKFNADTSAAMQWQFKPQQREIKVLYAGV